MEKLVTPGRGGDWFDAFRSAVCLRSGQTTDPAQSGAEVLVFHLEASHFVPVVKDIFPKNRHWLVQRIKFFLARGSLGRLPKDLQIGGSYIGVALSGFKLLPDFS